MRGGKRANSYYFKEVIMTFIKMIDLAITN